VLEQGKPDAAEDLLNFFVQKGLKEHFVSTLYTCYELIRPDIVLELAWRFNMTEFAMPYYCQKLREFSNKLESIQRQNEDREKKEEKIAKDQVNKPLDTVGDMIAPNMGI